MDINETCPACGAVTTIKTQSAKRLQLYCGCEKAVLRFDARTGRLKWAPAPRPFTQRKAEGGKVVPKDVADKMRKSFGTVTGRHSAGGPVRVTKAVEDPKMTEKELTFVHGGSNSRYKPIVWGVDIAVPEYNEPKPPEDKTFTGHAGPDQRTDLIKRFQDALGRDQ